MPPNVTQRPATMTPTRVKLHPESQEKLVGSGGRECPGTADTARGVAGIGGADVMESIVPAEPQTCAWQRALARLDERTREVIARGDHDELDSLSRARAAVAQLAAHPTHGAR